VVNLTKARELISWFAGSYRVRLNSGIEIDLSREQVKKLRQILKW
jgi:DNA-binding LytR/AlgR family response regulator